MAELSMKRAAISGMCAILALCAGLPPAVARPRRQPVPVVADLGNLSDAATYPQLGDVFALRRLLQEMGLHSKAQRFVVSYHILCAGHDDTLQSTYDRRCRAFTTRYFDAFNQQDKPQVSRLYRVTPPVIRAASQEQPWEENYSLDFNDSFAILVRHGALRHP